jgi:hypothetical protein
MNSQQTIFGSVSSDTVAFVTAHGRTEVIDRRHIAATRVAVKRHQIIGAVFLATATLMLIGAVYVLAVHHELKAGQAVLGIATAAIGVLLYRGRVEVAIETTGGVIRKRSAPLRARRDAETFIGQIQALSGR